MLPFLERWLQLAVELISLGTAERLWAGGSGKLPNLGQLFEQPHRQYGTRLANGAARSGPFRLLLFERIVLNGHAPSGETTAFR